MGLLLNRTAGGVHDHGCRAMIHDDWDRSLHLFMKLRATNDVQSFNHTYEMLQNFLEKHREIQFPVRMFFPAIFKLIPSQMKYLYCKSRELASERG